MLAINWFCNDLQICRLSPHANGAIALRPDRHAKDQEIVFFTCNVVTMARLALALADDWPDDLSLCLILAEGEMNIVTDHSEIAQWLRRAIEETTA